MGYQNELYYILNKYTNSTYHRTVNQKCQNLQKILKKIFKKSLKKGKNGKEKRNAEEDAHRFKNS